MPRTSRSSSGTDLKRKTTHALGWSFAGIFGPQVVQFGFSILLARLLAPADYGLIAMLTIFLAVAQSMVDSGFGSALIQKQDATATDESSVFYLNLVFACATYALLWFGAPFIAAFYEEPILTPLSRLMGVNFIINAFGLVPISILQKRLDFKTLAQRTLVAVVASGPVAVFLALQGYGVWSLAVQTIVSTALQTAALWYWSGWRPAPRFSRKALAGMFAYGSKLFFSGILGSIFDNLYPLLIGRLFTKTDLGFYAQARTYQRLPMMSITGVISQVSFPAFSSIQHDRPRLKAGYRKAIGLACYLVFPIMLGLIAIADPLFHVLLTDKWAPSVPYFRILCLVGMLFPLHSLNLNALKAVGRSDLFFRLEVAKKILTVAAVLITYRYGILAMVWGQVVNSYLSLFLNTYYTARFIDYPLTEQGRDILPYLLLSATMAGLVYAVGIPLAAWPVVQLLLQVLVGVGYYLAMSRLLRLSIFQEMTQFAADRRADRKETAGV